jgi:hypothetical protein
MELNNPVKGKTLVERLDALSMDLRSAGSEAREEFYALLEDLLPDLTDDSKAVVRSWLRNKRRQQKERYDRRWRQAQGLE